VEFRASELQTNLEELGKRPVDPIVFVNACITFDIIFVNRIEVDKSDLLWVDYFKTSGWKQSLEGFQGKQRVAYSLSNY